MCCSPTQRIRIFMVAAIAIAWGAPALAGPAPGGPTDTMAIYLDDPLFRFFQTNDLSLAPAALATNVRWKVSATATGFVPIAGNWDGSGGDTVGVYNPAVGTWFLKSTNVNGDQTLAAPFFVFKIASTPKGIPLTGDFDSDTSDTVALYDDDLGVFHFRNTNSGGAPDTTMVFRVTALGGLANVVPLVGDWNGDGTDSFGLYLRTAGRFFLTNSNVTRPPVDQDFVFKVNNSPESMVPVAGDWDGDGTDGVGLYDPATGKIFGINAFSSGAAIAINSRFKVTTPPSGTVVIGDWDAM